MSRAKANPAGKPRGSLSDPPAAPANILPAVPVPAVPARLGARGRALWAELWVAGGAAYHAPTDRFVIERYCLLQDRHLELWDLIDSDGFISTGSQGQTVLNPAARAIESVEKELRALEDRLGLNPEARARLGIVAAEAKSKLDAFMEEG